VVSSKDQTWIMEEITGPGSDTFDAYAGISSRYTRSDDLVIYQQVSRAFFIVKDQRVIDSFCWDVRTKAFKEMAPDYYIIREKAGFPNYMRSASYIHYLELKNQQHENSVKPNDTSQKTSSIHPPLACPPRSHLEHEEAQFSGPALSLPFVTPWRVKSCLQLVHYCFVDHFLSSPLN
jgi:hypothetical protein